MPSPPPVASTGRPSTCPTPPHHRAGVAGQRRASGRCRWPGPAAAPCRRRRRWPARRPPTRPHAPHNTGPVWPVRAGRRAAAGGRVPQPHRPVVAAGGQHGGRPAGRTPPPRTGPVWPVSGWPPAGRWPGPTAAPSRRRRRWPARRPSGGATPPPDTRPVWPVSGWPSGWPVAGSHSRTVPSAPPVASDAAVRGRTPPPPPGRCGRSAAGRGRPVAGSHSRTVPSPPPVASTPAVRRRHATAITGPVWPVSGWPQRPAGGRVPQPHRAVGAAGGQHRAAVRPAPSTPQHRAGVAGQRRGRAARRRPGPTAAPCGRPPVASTGQAAHLPPAPQNTRPVWPVSGRPYGASRRRPVAVAWWSFTGPRHRREV